MKKNVLVVDDEESLRFTFESFLCDEGYTVVTARSFDEAVELLREIVFDLVITDIILGDRTGIDLLRKVNAGPVTCPVIMITGFPTMETAVESVRLGAFDYIQKPVTQDTLTHAARMAMKHKMLMDENEQYRTNIETIFRSVRDGIITVDSEMRVIEMNRVAEALCGYTRDEALQQPIHTLPTGCSLKCTGALSASLSGNRPVEILRLECKHKDRPEQVVSVSASPLVSHEKTVPGAVMVLRDETHVVALEAELKDRHQFHTMIGKSEPMQKIYELIDQLSDYQTTVLIRGESGTGKELVAEAIHHRGVRSSRPLVKVNCAALPENLLESELFGHVKGAFTGAIKDKTGRFQRADGGTLFLDEISDISKSVQMRLLRVLQEMEFERVGDSTPVKVDVRVIAATNQDLIGKVRAGEFREDLYYRLKVVEITLPPLRERREDIPLLAAHFIELFNNKFHKAIENISVGVLERFMEYAWPGNIREFEHVLEHAFILCGNRVITLSHLPQDLFGQQKQADRPADDAEVILEALRKAGGNKAKAARNLGMSRRTLYRKIASLNPDMESPLS